MIDERRAAHAAYMREWARKNPEKVRASNAATRAKYRSQRTAAARVYYWANREQVLARITTRYGMSASVRGEKAQYDAAYRVRRRDYRTLVENRRRSRRVSNGGSHTLGEWQEKLELFAYLCAYCGQAQRITRDHKIPISRGGTDDISNIVPACMSCNSRKKSRTASEFLAVRVSPE